MVQKYEFYKLVNNTGRLLQKTADSELGLITVLEFEAILQSTILVYQIGLKD